MLIHRLQRWYNTETTFDQRLVFAGYPVAERMAV